MLNKLVIAWLLDKPINNYIVTITNCLYKQRPTRQWQRGKGVLESSGSVLFRKNKGSNTQRGVVEPVVPLSLPSLLKTKTEKTES